MKVTHRFALHSHASRPCVAQGSETSLKSRLSWRTHLPLKHRETNLKTSIWCSKACFEMTLLSVIIHMTEQNNIFGVRTFAVLTDLTLRTATLHQMILLFICNSLPVWCWSDPDQLCYRVGRIKILNEAAAAVPSLCKITHSQSIRCFSVRGKKGTGAHWLICSL